MIWGSVPLHFILRKCLYIIASRRLKIILSRVFCRYHYKRDKDNLWDTLTAYQWRHNYYIADNDRYEDPQHSINDQGINYSLEQNWKIFIFHERRTIITDIFEKVFKPTNHNLDRWLNNIFALHILRSFRRIMTILLQGFSWVAKMQKIRATQITTW